MCNEELVKELQTPCITPIVKQRGVFVMVWEAFANCKVGDLHQVKGKLNQNGYHSILLHHAFPSWMQLVSQGFELIQDNDPKHTSKLCQKCIKNKEEQHVLQLVSCLVQSADLNCIEMVSCLVQSADLNCIEMVSCLVQSADSNCIEMVSCLVQSADLNCIEMVSCLVQSADLNCLEMVSCLVQSADLNCIELMWDELGRKVRAK